MLISVCVSQTFAEMLQADSLSIIFLYIPFYIFPLHRWATQFFLEHLLTSLTFCLHPEKILVPLIQPGFDDSERSNKSILSEVEIEPFDLSALI